MLSLTHNSVSRWTTALLVGESVVDLSSSSLKEASSYHCAPFTIIRKMLYESTSLWNNPLLLPCIIITDHLSRVKHFCDGRLTEDVMIIEDQLGMTRVGRRNKEGVLPSRGDKETYVLAAERFKKGEPVERSQAMDLTIKINTQFTKVLFSKRSPTWNHEASEFLIATWKDSAEKLDGQGPDSHQICELLEHNINIAKSVEDHVGGLQTRLDLQLNVVR
jgi:hypothetical protein